MRCNAWGVGMLICIDTVLHLNSCAFGIISKAQSRVKSYELLKKLGIDLAIGWSMMSMYIPSGWRRLSLTEQTGCVFIGILCIL